MSDSHADFDHALNTWATHAADFVHKVEMERRAVEDAKQRARDEAIIRAACDFLPVVYDDDYPLPKRDIDAIIAAAEQEDEGHTSSYDVAPHYDPDEMTQAFAWRDWQTVEMLMDEQETP